GHRGGHSGQGKIAVLLLSPPGSGVFSFYLPLSSLVPLEATAG
ncbi:unnamed protein product, partial [Urochloa humidicola]